MTTTIEHKLLTLADLHKQATRLAQSLAKYKFPAVRPGNEFSLPAATVVASHLGVPLCLETFVDSDVLAIFDIVSSPVSEADHPAAAVYVTNEQAGRNLCSFACMTYTNFAEWRFLHEYYVTQAAFDLDGLLCEDPHVPDNDPGYIQHLINAKPLYLIQQIPIVIITARCEIYRLQTEQWLKNNNILVKELVMWPYEEAKRWEIPTAIASWKAAELTKRPEIKYYFESDVVQSKLIAEYARIPVVCLPAGLLYW
ncbi:MAG: hypothetical protein ACPL1K_02735 [Candidatus Kryptoniota bacterium]